MPAGKYIFWCLLHRCKHRNGCFEGPFCSHWLVAA